MLSETVIKELVAAIVPIVVAVGVILVKLKATDSKVDRLELNVNSKMDALLKAAEKIAFAEGKEKGIADEKANAILEKLNKLEALSSVATREVKETKSEVVTKEPALSLVAKDVTVTKKL